MAETTPSTPTGTEAAGDRVFTNILCAVDGSRKGYAAVEQAAALAGPQGQLTVLAVTAVEGSGVYRHAAISPGRAKLILEQAADIAESARVPCTVKVDPGGPPADVILASAVDYDLLALGAPARQHVGGLLLDSVAEDALASFTTPLLAARPAPDGSVFPKRIVLASDGLDGSDELVETIGRLARAHDAKVILVHAVGIESQSHPHRMEAQERTLESIIDGASEVDVQAMGAVEAILRAGALEGVSLIAAGCRRLDGAHAIGSVSRQVVHGAPCSVLLVPPAARG